MISARLAGVNRLALDTAPLIYLIELHPTFRKPVADVLHHASAAGIVLVTSALTVTEVLVHPLRLGRADLADQYRAILLGDSALRLVHLDAEVAIRAAELRARYNLRTPDAVQVASALVAGADAFLTNDGDLSRVAEIRVVQLRELVIG